MNLNKAVNEVEVNLNVVPREKVVSRYWARWEFKNFNLYLNSYRGSIWTEDETKFYDGWCVTAEEYDINTNAIKIVFYSDINAFAEKFPADKRLARMLLDN